MGRGSSKAGGAKSGGVKTPSGITYDQFMQMSEDERYDTMHNIINDSSIKTPSTLDDSPTTKVMYALGMNNKPALVDDDVLDTMQGKEIYRTVYETGLMPPPSTDMVTESIREADYTQLSGVGGSVHGRAIYFATDFGDSAIYGSGERNPMIMRAKINPGAKIMSESKLMNLVLNDQNYANKVSNHLHGGADDRSLWALSHGLDGWYSGTYTMMINRGALTASKKNKSIYGVSKFGRTSMATSWAGANDA